MRIATSQFRIPSTINRATYVVAGASCLLLKIAIDWSVSRYVFHLPWSPMDYIAPAHSLAMRLFDSNERNYNLTMLLVALPFIAVGTLLTAMRLRSVGISAGWTVLFFVPGINFAMFFLLTAMPGQKLLATAQKQPEPVPAVPIDPINHPPVQLGYARDAGAVVSRVRAFRARHPGALWGLSIFLPAIIGLAATFLSIGVLSSYALGLFIGVPFAIGLMAATIHTAGNPRGRYGALSAGCLSLTVYGVGLVLLAWEGVGCIIMAAPLGYFIAMIGSLVGAAIGALRDEPLDPVGALLAMLLFLPMFTGAEHLAGVTAPLYSVTSSVEINAPPERVWPNVIGFGQIPPPTDWIFRTGIAYPIRADIQGHGPGAMRQCVFSTGAFQEPITQWDEPRLLKFSVTSNPPPMKEWSPYSDVHPPHLKNFLVSEGGEFRLIALPNGRTRLEHPQSKCSV